MFATVYIVPLEPLPGFGKTVNVEHKKSGGVSALHIILHNLYTSYSMGTFAVGEGVD